MNSSKTSAGGDLGKRLFDVCAVGSVLLAGAPVFLGMGVIIALRLGRPVFFRQQRPGWNGRPFIMVKFRTMTDERDPGGKLLPDEKRLTSFGKFLRNASLDELPELWNVLKGEMSLVGPRPLLMQYLERYTPEQARRHEVKPGITGWAQINGRNAISWEEKFRLDLWYVDNRSFLLDLKILFLTIFKIIKKEGIQAASHASMPEFMGSGKITGDSSVEEGLPDGIVNNEHGRKG